MRLTRVGLETITMPGRPEAVDESGAERRTAEGMAYGRMDRPDDSLDFDEQLADLVRRRTVPDRDAVARQFEGERAQAALVQFSGERPELRGAAAPAVQREHERARLAPAARVQPGAQLDLAAHRAGRRLPGLGRITAARACNQVGDEARGLARRDTPEQAEQRRNVEGNRVSQR